MSKYNESDLVAKQIAIGAIIVNELNEILVMDHVKLDKWCIPVGKVEEGDTVKQTFSKEVEEELGIKIKSSFFVGTETNHYTRCGVEVEIDVVYAAVLQYEGEITNCEHKKHRSLRWMSQKEYFDMDYEKMCDGAHYAFNRLEEDYNDRRDHP